MLHDTGASDELIDGRHGFFSQKYKIVFAALATDAEKRVDTPSQYFHVDRISLSFGCWASIRHCRGQRVLHAMKKATTSQVSG
jgi:hypothetical protein